GWECGSHRRMALHRNSPCRRQRSGGRSVGCRSACAAFRLLLVTVQRPLCVYNTELYAFITLKWPRNLNASSSLWLQIDRSRNLLMALGRPRGDMAETSRAAATFTQDAARHLRPSGVELARCARSHRGNHSVF